MYRLLILALCVLMTGCGMIPAKSHPEIDAASRNQFENRPIPEGYNRIFICQSSGIGVGALGEHKLLITPKNSLYQILDNDNSNLLGELNFDEAFVLDLPLKKAIELRNPLVTDTRNRNTFGIATDVNQSFSLAIRWKIDARNSCIPVGTTIICDGKYKTNIELERASDLNVCRDKRIVGYKKL